MAIDRTALAAIIAAYVDDSGGGTDGTVITKTLLDTLTDAVLDAVENAFTWTDVTFAAGNFTASGSMTWTVASGDQTTFKYIKLGKWMVVWFEIETTTVGGTPSTDLLITIPGGFTSSNQVCNAIETSDNGTFATGYAQINAGATTIRCLRATNANWSAATNTTAVKGQILFQTTA